LSWLEVELLRPGYKEVQSKLGKSERIDVPTLMIQSESDSCDAPSESEGSSG
jgi:hypothetical protein